MESFDSIAGELSNSKLPRVVHGSMMKLRRSRTPRRRNCGQRSDGKV
jgi:hypothetical protein